MACAGLTLCASMCLFQVFDFDRWARHRVSGRQSFFWQGPAPDVALGWARHCVSRRPPSWRRLSGGVCVYSARSAMALCCPAELRPLPAPHGGTHFQPLGEGTLRVWAVGCWDWVPVGRACLAACQWNLEKCVGGGIEMYVVRACGKGSPPTVQKAGMMVG